MLYLCSYLSSTKMKNTFADRIINFYDNLEIKMTLPEGVSVMNPFSATEIKELSEKFYRKFYKDTLTRIMVLGINPGRFGAGVTGVTFTDPIRLEKECGIINSLDKRSELSSIFIYEMINRFGGSEKFYSKFYLTAVCPLGFVKNGKNMNYYDDKNLERSITGFIVTSLLEQIRFGIDRKICICLGEGKNAEFLEKLNREYNFFDQVIPLAHPRFIMQYRLKKKEEYMTDYLKTLKAV